MPTDSRYESTTTGSLDDVRQVMDLTIEHVCAIKSILELVSEHAGSNDSARVLRDMFRDALGPFSALGTNCKQEAENYDGGLSKCHNTVKP